MVSVSVRLSRCGVNKKHKKRADNYRLSTVLTSRNSCTCSDTQKKNNSFNSPPKKMKPKPPSTPSGQRTLTSFFKKTETPKRKNQEEDENKVTKSTTPMKKQKLDSPVKTPPPQATNHVVSVLTPEQKKMVLEKQAVARLKLVAHKFTLIDASSIGSSWFVEVLDQEFKKPYFKTLDHFYEDACRRSTVYPQRQNIFSWTRHCDIRNVKVVIIGQDPYHGPNQAHGLCFSVQKGVAIPPSLLNMYKELVQDPGVPAFTEVPKHGHLVGWAEQGVLLLNAVLTVEASKANSHKDKGWENLTQSTIKWISSNLRNVVFLTWGKFAQDMAMKANVDKTRHKVLSSVHPSPLSAHRGFFGCGHFSKVNELLVQNGLEPIRWEHLP